MRRKMTPILIFLIILSFTSYAFAYYPPTFDGKPTALDSGVSTGYFIWQDKEGLHLRTAVAGIKHVFSGTIHTDGAFMDVFGKAVGADDSFLVSRDGDRIKFRFTGKGGTSGIDLHVQDGTHVTFNLAMDENKTDTENIFIGRSGWHPGNSKLTLRYNPAQYNDGRTVIIVSGAYWWTYSGDEDLGWGGQGSYATKWGLGADGYGLTPGYYRHHW